MVTGWPNPLGRRGGKQTTSTSSYGPFCEGDVAPVRGEPPNPKSKPSSFDGNMGNRGGGGGNQRPGYATFLAIDPPIFKVKGTS